LNDQEVDGSTSNDDYDEPPLSNPSFRRRRALVNSPLGGERDRSPLRKRDPGMERQPPPESFASTYAESAVESSSGPLGKSAKVLLEKLCRLCDIDIDTESSRFDDESVTQVLREVHKRVLKWERDEDDRAQLEEKYRKYKNMCVRYKKICGDLRNEQEMLQNQLDNIPADITNDGKHGLEKTRDASSLEDQIHALSEENKNYQWKLAEVRKDHNKEERNLRDTIAALTRDLQKANALVTSMEKSRGRGEIERDDTPDNETNKIRTYNSSSPESRGRGASKATGGSEAMRWLEAENQRLEEQVKYVQEEIEDIRTQLERSLRKAKSYDQLEKDYNQMESRTLASERTNRTLEQLRAQELERLQDSELKNVRWKSQCDELRKKLERISSERQSAESLQRRLAISEAETKRWKTRCESQLAADNNELIELRRDNEQKNRLLVRYETRLCELEGDALTRGSRFTRMNTRDSLFSRGEYDVATADNLRQTARQDGGVLLDRNAVEPGKGGCIDRTQEQQPSGAYDFQKLRRPRSPDYNRQDLERLKDRLDQTFSKPRYSNTTSPQDNSYSRNTSTQTSFPNSRRSLQSWSSQRQLNVKTNPPSQPRGYPSKQLSRSWRRGDEIRHAHLDRAYSTNVQT